MSGTRQPYCTLPVRRGLAVLARAPMPGGLDAQAALDFERAQRWLRELEPYFAAQTGGAGMRRLNFRAPKRAQADEPEPETTPDPTPADDAGDDDDDGGFDW